MTDNYRLFIEKLKAELKNAMALELGEAMANVAVEGIPHDEYRTQKRGEKL